MITLFTGAGASKALKFPTTAEFFAKAGGQALQKNVVYREVLHYLKKNILDVEDVLRLLAPLPSFEETPTGKLIRKVLDASWIAQVPDFVKSTNKLCFEHYAALPKEHEVKELYLPILELCNWKTDRVSLFTTNYDPVTDVLMEIAESLEAPCHDGFDRFGVWDSGGYSNLKSSGLAIHRLHGSMSWVEQEGKIRNTRDYSPRTPGYAEHLIIYPGFKGNLEKEGPSALRFAHTALRNELGESSAVILVGFSFRDPHLNDIFREALTTNQKLMMVVWNPVWPEGSDVGLAELKQEFEKRIVHLAASFGEDGAVAKLQDLLK